MNKPAPLATILFLAYNQQDFVAQAARSCLEQQCEALEIIFSDDFSSDNTFAILQELVLNYQGPHQVTVRQNSRNLGIADHVNTLVKLARRELLITAAGDDISYPQRAQTLVDAWRASNCKLDLIASHAQSITNEGQNTGKQVKVDQLANWNSVSDWCRKRPYVIGATHAFTKRIWTKFGDIASDIPYEDQVITLRALSMGGGATLETPLLNYRQGGISAKELAQSPQAKRAQIYKRYSRQQAVFRQVHRDLETTGCAHLWTGKVERYLLRSDAALWLLEAQANDRMNLRRLIVEIRKCGFFWLLRQVAYTYFIGGSSKSCDSV